MSKHTTKTARLFTDTAWLTLGDLREFVNDTYGAPDDAELRAGMDDENGAQKIDVIEIEWATTDDPESGDPS